MKKRVVITFGYELWASISTEKLEIHRDAEGTLSSIEVDEGAQKALPYFKPDEVLYIFVEDETVQTDQKGEGDKQWQQTKGKRKRR